MLKRTFQIGLIDSSEDNIGVRIRKEGKDDFTMSQLWFWEGLPGLEPPGGWGRQPGGIRSAIENLCEVYVFREQGIKLSVQESRTLVFSIIFSHLTLTTTDNRCTKMYTDGWQLQLFSVSEFQFFRLPLV